MIPTCEILIGDVRAKLRELKARGVKARCIVTSPPYWALRDYGTEPQVWGGREDCAHEWGEEGSMHRGGPQGETGDRATRDTAAQDETGDVRTGQFCQHCGAWRGQLGLEPTPELFVEHMVEVFDHAWDVLADDGTLWMNFGDSYAGGGNGPTGADSTLMGNGHQGGGPKRRATDSRRAERMPAARASGLKPKDLVGMPWRVAFALQASGWYLRSDIVWHKPNPMPESVTDRPTKAHEYLFLLTKSPRYYYDAEAIKEPVTGNANPRGAGVNKKAVAGWMVGPGSHSPIDHAKKDAGGIAQDLRDSTKFGRGPGWRVKQNESFSAAVAGLVDTRNKRTVWSIPTEPYSEAHYATFPRDLVRPCILAGSALGDTVLDIFGGSGTVGEVALEYGRNALLIDLNPNNHALMSGRTAKHAGQGVLAV